MVDDCDVVPINAQLHTWEQTLFYLAALEAYPPADIAVRVEQFADCGGAIEAIRQRDRGRSDTASWHGR